jgi:regulatory protein
MLLAPCNLPMDEQKKQAWIVSLRLLEATPKSRRDLSQKLKDKGFSQDLIEETLNELEARGILSDKAFAQNIVTRLTHGNPSGSRKISFELKRKGVPNAIREEILAKIDPEREAERAKDLAKTRWERLANQPFDKRKKKVFDFLLRRGFDYQLVRDTMEALGRDSSLRSE